MSAKILPATVSAIRKAARLLKKGRLVVFPTETVYGLGADAFDVRAVSRIFELKRRPFFDPIIVHALNARQAFSLGRAVSAPARRLGQAFWPGPLTIVLPKSPRVPDIVTAGFDTVAVRVPAHPAARALLKEFGGPIAAPSANSFGRFSPTTARMVYEDLGRRVDFILNGGPCRVGVESTVVKFEKGKMILLRPGGIPLEALKKFGPVAVISKRARPFESPGRLKSHYAPQTPLVLAGESAEKFAQKLRQGKRRRLRMGLLAFRKNGRACHASAGTFHSIVYLSQQGDLVEAASRLFQAMRKLDKMRLDFIIAEPVPERGLGRAIMDRLKKASS